MYARTTFFFISCFSLSCKLEQTKFHSLSLRWLKTESSDWILNPSMQKRLLLRKAEWTPTITHRHFIYSPSSRGSENQRNQLVYNPHDLCFFPTCVKLTLTAAAHWFPSPYEDNLGPTLTSPRLTIQVWKSVAPAALLCVNIMFLWDIFGRTHSLFAPWRGLPAMLRRDMRTEGRKWLSSDKVTNKLSLRHFF